jgi:hypothetical protein
MELWYLYVIRLPVNDYAAAYVGVTKQRPPRKRFYAHGHDKHPISRAIQQCGKEAVVFEILESGSREHIVDRREAEAILAMGTRWPRGYNIASGGQVCRDMLPQTKAKISAASLLPERVTRLREMARTPESRARVAARNRTPEFIAQVNTPEIVARKSELGKRPENLARLAAARATLESREWRESQENREQLARAKEQPDFRERQLTGIKSPENRAHLSEAQRTSSRARLRSQSIENLAQLTMARDLGRGAQLISARSIQNVERLRAMAQTPENKNRIAAIGRSQANIDRGHLPERLAVLRANGAALRGKKWTPERIAKRTATRRANHVLRRQERGVP